MKLRPQRLRVLPGPDTPSPVLWVFEGVPEGRLSHSTLLRRLTMCWLVPTPLEAVHGLAGMESRVHIQQPGSLTCGVHAINNLLRFDDSHVLTEEEVRRRSDLIHRERIELHRSELAAEMARTAEAAKTEATAGSATPSTGKKRQRGADPATGVHCSYRSASISARVGEEAGYQKGVGNLSLDLMLQLLETEFLSEPVRVPTHENATEIKGHHGVLIHIPGQ